MSEPASHKKEWILTREAFDGFLLALDHDRERAGYEYENLRDKLIRFFVWRNRTSPEDLADETINRVVRRIAGGEVIQNITGYSHGVAQMVLMEVMRNKAKEQDYGERLRYAHGVMRGTDESTEQNRCFSQCLDRLSAEARGLIIEYYQADRGAKIENRKKMADMLGLPLARLRVQAHRIRGGLDACVKDCLRE